jgi:flavin-dependent dehydrogenase
VAEDTPELYFYDDLKGYGWCVLKGAWLNIGLGREERGSLPARLDAFCRSLEGAGRIPRLPARGFKGHAYLLYGHGSRPLVTDAALLIGDAAGLAYPQSGEGIRPAVESGLLAADAIIDVRPNYSADRLDAYRLRLEQRLGPPRWTGTGTQRLKRALAAALFGNRWLTRSLLLERWFLRRAAPPLGAADPHR